ncbi:thiamine ABC transporter permease [Vibrio sp. qd031]|uniref:ABC transporter permease n=1 Tax=Vibrio sp. qd031 TaxID=1603038 RepID=UPI0011808720|nr:thiamine ABC transporter permease [Vibrio sp. qd031]
MYRTLGWLIASLSILPLIPGIFGVIASALGYMPMLGLNHVGIDYWNMVWQWPGVERSLSITIVTATVSTVLSVYFCFSILHRSWDSHRMTSLLRWLSPMLAFPHVGFAIGFALLWAPTGFIARIIEPLFSDSQFFEWFVKDPYGIGLIFILILKETPFLLLMSLSVLSQIPYAKLLPVASGLGYSKSQFWWKVILPIWLPKMRFAIFSVLAYGISVVDVALIIGPTQPTSFAVLVWQWFNEPQLELLPRAASGAVLLAIVTLLSLTAYWLLEKALLNRWNSWQFSGKKALWTVGNTPYRFIQIMYLFIIPLLVVWSVAKRWRFPDIMPTSWSWQFWQNEWHSLSTTLWDSTLLAFITAAVATVLTATLLQLQSKGRFKLPLIVILIPLVIPQLSLLFGLQITALVIAPDNHLFWVIWAHLFFALPYVYLSLKGPWLAYEERYSQVSLSLGKSPLYTFIAVKCRLLAPPLLFAWAVGASVSLAQYLPTLMLGGGRIATITTEAVALTSGSDRRIMAIYGLWQTLLPLIFYSIAMAASVWLNKSASKRAVSSRKSTLTSHQQRASDDTFNTVPTNKS